MYGDPFQNIRNIIKMPVSSMKTYGLAQPMATHWRDGTCEECFCDKQAKGWLSMIDENTDLGKQQAYYIRKLSGRKYTESKAADGLTHFVFEAGQKCFKQHKVPLERDPIVYVRGGDFRGNPRQEIRRHSRIDDWVDDFATHQDSIAEAVEEG